MIHAILFAFKAIGYIKEAIAAGRDVSAFVKEAHAAVEKMHNEQRGPTPEEWGALNKQIDDLRAELHKPD